MENDSTASVLQSALERLGAREFEIIALSMVPDRGLAALEYAIEKGAEHPIAYAIKLFDSDDWQPSGEVTRRGTNRSAPSTQCRTCGGDRFVVVGSRPVVQTQWMREHGIEVSGSAAHEEYAPCPDCNPADASFRRFDGTMANPPDPAKVRQLMEG